MNIIHNIPPKLSGWISLDLELVNTNVRVLHRPQGGDFALLTICDGKNTWVIHNEVDVPSAIHNIQDCIWIFHNAKFDLTHLRRWADIPQRNKVWDTMLLDKIMYSGYYDSFSLADLSRRYLGKFLDKSLQKEWSNVDLKNIPPEYMEYAISDAVTTWQVAMEQKKQVKKQDFWIWSHIDLPAMWAVMDFMGFRIDTQCWLDLAEKNRIKSAEIDASLPFNIRSYKVAREYLSKRGFRGLPNTQESTIETWIAKYPDTEAAALAKISLEGRKYAKRASTYGKSFIANYIERDLVHNVDIVFGDYNIIGAETGRLCISGDTILSTSLGDFAIRDLALTTDKKYLIMSHTGKMQEISARFYKGKEMMYGIYTADGSHIKCTRNHRILTTRGWRFIKELEIGDMAITKNNKAVATNIDSKFYHSGRRNICGISNTKEIKQDGYLQGISDPEQSYYGCIETDIRTKIQRSIKTSETLSILDGFARKYAWEEKPTFSFDTEGETITLDKFRKETIRYCKAPQYERIFSSSKCQIFWDRSTRRIAFWSAKSGFGIFEVARDIRSWINRISQILLFKPTRLLREIVRRILTSISDSLVHQRSSIRSFLLSRKKQSRKGSYMLEQQQKRDDFGISFIRQAYPTHKAIQLLQEISSRLFLPTSQFNSGDTGKCSRFTTNTREGQRKTTNYFPNELELFGNIGSRDLQESIECGKFNRSEIVLIRECGSMDVWDIGVDIDHSYVAGGFINHNSCTSPNMQNIPSKDTKDFRRCFKARPGYKLVIADYSQQEIGIAAYISKDKNLLEIFNSGKDIYIAMAKVMYGKTITHDDPLRKRMKSVVLGTNYGMSKYGLARKEQITEDEAEEFLNKFAKAFPDLSSWMGNQQKIKNFTNTILKRKTFLNPYSSQHERNALNNPIQGSAADMIKLALIELRRYWEFDDVPFSVVAVIHDEIVLDVPEQYAEDVKNFVKASTVNAANRMCPDIKMSFRADVVISSDWSEK